MPDFQKTIVRLVMQQECLFSSCVLLAIIGLVLSSKKREFFVLVTVATLAAIFIAPTFSKNPNAWAHCETDELLLHIIGRHWPTWTGILVGCVIGQLAARRKEGNSLAIAVVLSAGVAFITSLVLGIANLTFF